MPRSKASLLEVAGLRVSFARRGREITVVDGIDYRLDAGKTLAIVGESGAGKTLSSRALLGLLPPGATVLGSARLEGVELLGLSERAVRRFRGKYISMVFQDPARSLNPTMRVGHQIAETIREHERASGRAARSDAIDLLHLLRFEAPKIAYARYPHELSGGMQQRIMIAIALAGRPKLLIADEATRSLDTTTQAEIMALLVDLQSRLGMAMIMISHDLRLAAAFADDVLVMRAGRCVEHGPASTLFRCATMPYTRALLGAGGTTCPACPPSRPRGRTPSPRTPLLSARDIVQEYRAPGWNGGYRGVVRAVSGVSLDLYPGETLGLVGETGAGKSTLARTLLMAPPPTSGSVVLNGVELTTLKRRDLAARRHRMQIVFQDPYGSLDPQWTVAAIVEEPLIGRGTIRRGERRRRVRELLDLVGLPLADYGRRRPQALSGGQCQRVAIARALAPRPRLIVLDEALSSLDALIQGQMLDLLRRLGDELGVALLMISHDLAQVAHICDRVAVMRAGQLCEVAPTDVLYRSPSHPHTAALLAAMPASRPTLVARESFPPASDQCILDQK